MGGRLLRRREDEKEETGKPLVQTEGDWLRSPGERRHHSAKARDLAVRYCGLLADYGGAKPLTVEQEVNEILGAPHGACPLEVVRHVDEHLLPGVRRDVQENMLGLEEIT